MAVDHTLENVPEISVRLDAVELRGGDEGADYGPALAAAIGAGEQMVIAPERHGPDGALDGVGVELDAAIVEEAAERRPACQGIADGLGQPTARRNQAQLVLQPGLYGLDERS